MRRSNADTCSFFLKALGMAVGWGERVEGVGRKRPLLKFCDLKGMTFTSICLIPLLCIFRKSKVVS